MIISAVNAKGGVGKTVLLQSWGSRKSDVK